VVFGRDDLADLADFAASASCRDGVGRPFALADGVGRFFGGVTRLLVTSLLVAGVASFFEDGFAAGDDFEDDLEDEPAPRSRLAAWARPPAS